jgi:hypothetical protein
MIIKTTYDIETRNAVYAICDPATEQCYALTTDILKSIKLAQCETFQQIQTLFANK